MSIKTPPSWKIIPMSVSYHNQLKEIPGTFKTHILSLESVFGTALNGLFALFFFLIWLQKLWKSGSYLWAKRFLTVRWGGWQIQHGFVFLKGNREKGFREDDRINSWNCTLYVFNLWDKIKKATLSPTVPLKLPLPLDKNGRTQGWVLKLTCQLEYG